MSPFYGGVPIGDAGFDGSAPFAEGGPGPADGPDAQDAAITDGEVGGDADATDEPD